MEEKRLCQMPSVGFGNLHECPNQGKEWPGIRERLCRPCFKLSVVDQQWALLCRVEEEYIKYRDMLYNAEVADGLRPSPRNNTFEGFAKHLNAQSLTKKVVAAKVYDNEGAI